MKYKIQILLTHHKISSTLRYTLRLKFGMDISHWAQVRNIKLFCKTKYLEPHRLSNQYVQNNVYVILHFCYYVTSLMNHNDYLNRYYEIILKYMIACSSHN